MKFKITENGLLDQLINPTDLESHIVSLAAFFLLAVTYAFVMGTAIKAPIAFFFILGVVVIPAAFIWLAMKVLLILSGLFEVVPDEEIYDEDS